MPYYYATRADAKNPWRLPNIETFRNDTADCPECGTPVRVPFAGESADCPECDTPVPQDRTRPKWYWHACFPGCMPDSEPYGPYSREREALADARRMMGGE